MRNQNDKSKKRIFDNYFFNLNFSITMVYTELKFCFLIIPTHSEGTVSHIFLLGLSFYFMSKNGKPFAKCVKLIF